MSNKKIFMSVTASAVIASAFFGAESADAATTTYKVKPGDTLWKISQQYNTSVAQLKSWNGLTSEIIFPNQELTVDNSGTKSSSSSSSKKSSSSSNSSGSSSSSSKASTYTVKSGDTLSHIARANGVTVQNLMDWNNLKNHMIYPGQVFQVGNGSASNSSSSASSSSGSSKSSTASKSSSGNSSSSNKSSSSASSGGSTYTVKSGDTLSQIASAHGISLQNLMSWNNLNTTLIYPGNKLVVSQSGSSSSSSKSSSSGSSASKSSNSSSSKSSSNSGSSSGSTTTYTVKSGDSLSKIAAAYGVTVNNLMSWNNLKSTTIYIGDKLSIYGDAAVPAMKDNSSSSSSSSSSGSSSASGLIDIAKSVMGVPYVWGGSSMSGFDCSGYIYWAFNQAGHNISRLSTDGYYNRSYIVNNPQVGDLVFFEGTYRSGISHMGIYLGNNQFIHAGSSTGVTIASLDSNYWSKHFHSFKRFY